MMFVMVMEGIRGDFLLTFIHGGSLAFMMYFSYIFLIFVSSYGFLGTQILNIIFLLIISIKEKNQEKYEMNAFEVVFRYTELC